MTPYYADDWLSVYLGDAREVMAEMPAESVNCVVTSPPYWGLRDYGEPGQLGLEPTPEAYVAAMVGVFREVRRVLRSDGTVWLNLGSSYATAPAGNVTASGFQQRSAGGQAGALAQWQPDVAGASDPSPSRRPSRAPAYGTGGTGPRGSRDLGSAYSDLCDGCRGALSPRTPGTHRPDPDDASPPSLTGRDTEPPGSGPASPDASPLGAQASTTTLSEQPPPGPCSHCGNCGACLSVLRSSSRDVQECGRKAWLNYPTFKPKDMVPIPWLVALALQADGWYLRSDIIWAKPNPMPESVTDRPTKSHEYLFLLTKSARYYYDANAVAEPITDSSVARLSQPSIDQQEGSWRVPGKTNGPMRAVGGPSWQERKAAGATAGNVGVSATYQNGVHGNGLSHDLGGGATRNLRSVWTIATQPYPGAHFATFPEALVEPCVKAGTSSLGVCATCGASWSEEVERVPVDRTRRTGLGVDSKAGTAGRAGTPSVRGMGWRQPTCGHDGEPVPATVLDPFAGSGTTGRVANRLSRRAILIDLSADYLDQAMVRNRQTPLGLGA